MEPLISRGFPHGSCSWKMSRIHQMRRAVYISAGALFCFNCLPHAFPAFVRKSYELQKCPVPEELASHVQKIAAAMRLSHPERIRVFISSGFSSISGGSTELPRGAAIGLSRTVLCRSEEDIRGSGITLEGEAVDWSTERGRQMAELLLPSAQQINFSIAHEVAHLQHRDFLYHAVLSPLTLITGYHAAKTIPKYTFPQHRTAGFGLILMLTLVAHVHLSAALHRWQEHRADHSAGLCHHSYCRGGTELMQRQILLHSLTRPLFSSKVMTYTSLHSHPPFAERLEKLEKLLAVAHGR